MHSIQTLVNGNILLDHSYSELLNFEKAFNTDLNDDGKVGDTITEVFSQHSQKNKGLYKGESGAIVIDPGDLPEGSQTSSPLVLKKEIVYIQINRNHLVLPQMKNG